MTTYSEEARARWLSMFRACRLTQARFVKKYRESGGPSERTLRAWLRAASSPDDVDVEVRRVVVNAIEQLRELLGRVDDALARQRAADGDVRHPGPAAVSAASDERGEQAGRADVGSAEVRGVADDGLVTTDVSTKATESQTSPRIVSPRRRGLFAQDFV